ncbi:MAG: hypothetical protein K0S68_996 [Candidatus Saccharibacteria bacterium]|jgi:uncharacterized protein YdhG (YjbR/CyaY superfamily)|nr:hypothetical protein [Candidatus Saccharibacteria bacterium]
MTVDEYLSALPEADRTALEILHATIKHAVPEATETIAYQVPAFKVGGKALVSYMAKPKHLSLILQSPKLMPSLAKVLEGYKVSGTTIHFTADKPLPTELITKLVRARLAEVTN